jgi:Ca-activated chloride channel family protein
MAVPLAWWALVVARRVRERRLAALAGEGLDRLLPRRAVALRWPSGAVFAAGVLLAAMALLQPAWGEATTPAARRPVDIVVCLDVSRSMLARDVAPSRLEAARRALASLARHAPGERLALVAFAGEARLVVPLTVDGEGFAALAAATGPLSVRRGGTELGAALEAALAALGESRGEEAAILLVTDGEDLGGGAAAALERCVRDGVVVHGVLAGTARGGKIPVDDGRGETFQRDAAGRDIVTVADAAGLRALTARTGGEVVDGSFGPDVLADLYERRILPRAREAAEVRERASRSQRFQWPLLGAVLLWLGDLHFGRRRTR